MQAEILRLVHPGRGARSAGLGLGVPMAPRLVYRWEGEGKDGAGGAEENGEGHPGASRRPPPPFQVVRARPSPTSILPILWPRPFSERAPSLPAGPLGPRITQGLWGSRLLPLRASVFKL